MNLCDALRQAVRQAEEPTQRGRARSLDDVIDTFGDRRSFYAWVAGTADRRSPAYQAASRRVRRYLQGTRRPSGAFLRRARGAATRRAAHERQLERRRRLGEMGSRVFIHATISVSSRKDVRHRRIDARFRPECWEEIAEALDAGDCHEAERIFSECVGEENGFGEPPEFDDVDVLDPAV